MSSRDPSPRQASEAELDDLLSKVSDLTENLAEEVGAAAAAPPAKVDATAGSIDDELSRAIDARTAAPPSRGRVVQLGKTKAPSQSAPAASPAVATPPTRAEPVARPSAPAAPQPATAASEEPSPQWDLGSPYSEPRGLGRVLCLALDVLDWPFRWCGLTLRAAAGWVALAVLFAAAVVLLLSFLQ